MTAPRDLWKAAGSRCLLLWPVTPTTPLSTITNPTIPTPWATHLLPATLRATRLLHTLTIMDRTRITVVRRRPWPHTRMVVTTRTMLTCHLTGRPTNNRE